MFRELLLKVQSIIEFRKAIKDTLAQRCHLSPLMNMTVMLSYIKVVEVVSFTSMDSVDTLDMIWCYFSG